MNKSISELPPRHLALAILFTLQLVGCGRLRYEPRDVGQRAFDIGLTDFTDTRDPWSDSGAIIDTGALAPRDTLFTFRDAPLDNCPTALGALGAGSCPATCNGGCDGGVCAITCTAVGACIGDIVCPPGWPCQVSCIGFRSCTAATFDGTGATSLSVECAGDETCVAAEMICPTAGDCGVLCGGAMSCVSFALACGPGRCAADCSGASATSFDQQCNGSGCCSLVNCG